MEDFIDEVVSDYVNGKLYLKEAFKKVLEHKTKESEYKIVRTYSAGVFAGYIEKREGSEVTLTNARRLWKWEGAASLSQLAQSGTSMPNNCKFAEPVDRVLLLNVIEIIDVTEKAKESIDSVSIWRV